MQRTLYDFAQFQLKPPNQHEWGDQQEPPKSGSIKSKAIPFKRYPRELQPTQFNVDQLSTHSKFSKYIMAGRSGRYLDPTTDDLVFFRYSAYVENRTPTETEFHLYGSDAEGSSVCLKVRSFRPYCYVGIPESMSNLFADKGPKEVTRFMAQFHKALHNGLRKLVMTNPSLHRRYHDRYSSADMILPIDSEAVVNNNVLLDAKDVFCYNEETTRLLKITCAEPQLIPLVKQLLWFPHGWNYKRCSVCQWRNGSNASRDVASELLQHHKDCGCMVHMECAQEYGQQLRQQRFAGDFESTQWFSACMMCTGGFASERLKPKGSEELQFSNLRTELYGDVEILNYPNWYGELQDMYLQYDMVLPVPEPTTVDAQVQLMRASRMGHHAPHPSFSVYAADIPFVARFGMDTDTGAGWCIVPKGKWCYENRSAIQTIATLEVVCSYEHIRSSESMNKKKEPVFTVISLDMEMSNDGTFCKHERDPVIQVPMLLKSTADMANKKGVLFALGSMLEKVDGAEVFSYPYDEFDREDMEKQERALIRDVCIFLAVVRPNVLITYNGGPFDIPYFVSRGLVLGVPEARAFGSWRLGLEGDTVWKPDILRNREIARVTMKGVFFFDELFWIMKHFNGPKWKSFNLNTAAKNILGKQKKEMDPTRMGEYQRTAAGRYTIGVYAMTDVYLPMEIEEVRFFVFFIINLSQLFGVQMQDITECGNNLIMGTALQCYAHKEYRKLCGGVLCVIPTKRRALTHPDDKAKKYEGALVIDAKVGIYHYAATMDFGSLYPSIMKQYGLCQSTFLYPEKAEQYGLKIGEHVWQRPDFTISETEGVIETHNPLNPMFVKSNVKTGFIVCYQNYLKKTRTEIRAAGGPLNQRMKAISVELQNPDLGEAEKAVLIKEKKAIAVQLDKIDQEQNAVKTGMNGIYGLHGLSVSQWFRLAIAETITLMGQHALATARWMAESTYTRANGYAGDLRVIYGDTDSIMCILENCTIEHQASYIHSLMYDLSKRLKQKFDVLDLQPEKIYIRYLLARKKMYMAIKRTLDGQITTDIKGFKFKKKISTLMHMNACQYILDVGFIQDNVEKALDYVRDLLVRIHTRRASIAELSSSVCFSKSPAEAERLSAPMEVAVKVAKRTGRWISTQERFNMIILEDFSGHSGKAGIAARAEEASYAEYEGLQYDVHYYKEDLIKTVTPLLQYMIKHKGTDAQKAKKVKALLEDHPILRSHQMVGVASQRNGAITGFVQTDNNRCIACHRKLGLSGFQVGKKRPYMRIQDQGGERDTCATLSEAEERLVREFSELRGVKAKLTIPRQSLQHEPLPARFCDECALQSNAVSDRVMEQNHKRMRKAVDCWDKCRKCSSLVMKGDNAVTCITTSCENNDARRESIKEIERGMREVRSVFV